MLFSCPSNRKGIGPVKKLGVGMYVGGDNFTDRSRDKLTYYVTSSEKTYDIN